MTTEPSPATLPRRAGAIALALVTTAIALAPVPATATTFAEVTLEDLARASDLVVIGRVEHIDVLPHGPGGQPGIHTRATPNHPAAPLAVPKGVIVPATGAVPQGQLSSIVRGVRCPDRHFRFPSCSRSPCCAWGRARRSGDA